MGKHLFKTLALALMIAVLSGLGSALALQVHRAPWPVLVAEAHRVVHGHVSATWTHLAPDGSGRVLTRHELLVWDELPLRGARGMSRIVVTLPGGRLGSRVTVVPGLGPLELGDEVVLLLSPTPWGWQPIGYELGMVRLSEGEPLPWSPKSSPWGALDSLRRALEDPP
jgi:hypothetical protein